MKEEYNNPWLLSPPPYRAPSCLQGDFSAIVVISSLLEGRCFVPSSPGQGHRVGGIIGAWSQLGLLLNLSSAFRQVREHLSWLLVLFRTFTTLSTWFLEFEMFGLGQTEIDIFIARKMTWVDQLSSTDHCGCHPDMFHSSFLTNKLKLYFFQSCSPGQAQVVYLSISSSFFFLLAYS